MIYAKPAHVDEIMAETPQAFAIKERRYYRMEQLSAMVRSIEGQEVVFLTYISGKSESNTTFVNHERYNFRTGLQGETTMACDPAHYKDILDRVGAAVTAK